MKKKILICLSAIFCIAVACFWSFFFYSSSPSLSLYDKSGCHARDYPVSNRVDSLVIMTYNIGYLSGMTNNLSVHREATLFDLNLHIGIGVLSAQDIDIIGFQELDFNSRRSFGVNQEKELAEALKFPFSFYSVNWDLKYLPFPNWPPKNHFGKVISGQAIMSKHPLHEYHTITLDRPQQTSFVYDAFYLDRLLQMTDVVVGKQTVKLMNVHLEAFDEDTRVKQAHMVRTFYEKYANHMPVVLLGDFNSAPEYTNENQKAMKVIMGAKYICSAISKNQYEAGRENSYTFDTRRPTIMIDYILYNQNFIKCHSAQVLRQIGEVSDHYPVLGRFSMVNPTK